jgi:hypothetical protein
LDDIDELLLSLHHAHRKGLKALTISRANKSGVCKLQQRTYHLHLNSEGNYQSTEKQYQPGEAQQA